MERREQGRRSATPPVDHHASHEGRRDGHRADGAAEGCSRQGKRKAEEAAAALKRRNEALREAAKVAQFKELGLTGTGDRPTPGTGSLINRAQSMQKQIKGTVLDTDKTR